MIKTGVYWIVSRWSLEMIRDFLYNLGNGKIDLLRVIRSKNGKETRLNVCLADPSVYEEAVKLGYIKKGPQYDFSISPFSAKPSAHPRPDLSYNLYIPLPKTFQLSQMEVFIQLSDKMLPMIGYDLVSTSDYKIVIPVSSREKGKVLGSAFIIFRKIISRDKIISCKLLLHQTWWKNSHGVNSELMNCYWAKKKVEPPLINYNRLQNGNNDWKTNTETPTKKIRLKIIDKKNIIDKKQDLNYSNDDFF